VFWRRNTISEEHCRSCDGMRVWLRKNTLDQGSVTVTVMLDEGDEI